MLKIKDIISMLKDLYKSNLILENVFDVLLTISTFSFCCNFLSKIGLAFVVCAGVLYVLDVATGVVVLTLFTPSILVFVNLPIAYIRNITKDIKQYKKENKINDTKYIEKNHLKEINNNMNNNYLKDDLCQKNSKMVRVRKK